MNTSVPFRRPSAQFRGALLLVASLSLLFASWPAAAMAAEADPARPTSNKGTSPPPDGGDPGGGDPGGGGRKVALGIAVEDGRNMSVVDAHIAAVGGNAPATWVIRVAWGNLGSRTFPATASAALASRGITPMVWWTPQDPANIQAPTYSRHKNVNNGLYDAYIRDFARGARDYGGDVLLRFAHEGNSNWFPWSITRHDNSAQSYVAMWRRVYDIFQAEGATNVRFVWSVAKEVCSGGCNPYHKIWPGKAYVDVMGFTAYNWGTHREWVSMVQTYKRPMKLLPEISNLPIMVTETGSSPDGGNKATWIRSGYQQVYKEYPLLAGIVYTDVDLGFVGHPDWRLSTPAAALVAYAEIAAMPKFQGKVSLLLSAKKTKVKAVSDGDKKKRTKKSSEPNQASKPAREPRVEKGAVTSRDDEASKASGTGSNTKNKTTKKRRKDKAPPAPLDSFSR